MIDRQAAARQVALLVVVFIATLVLLAGGWAAWNRFRSSASAGASPVAIGSLAPGSSSTGGSSAVGSATPVQSGGPGSASRGPSTATAGPSAATETIVLTGAGDIADCSLRGDQQTSDLLIKQAGFVYTVGDNAYPNGSPNDYASCYAPTWGRVLDRTILPAPGNHDWETSGAAGYLGYFGSAAAPDGVTWYSKDVGAWHVIVLDSDCDQVGGCDASSPQGKWLAHDLAASAAHCTLAIWHHPRFSSGEHGDDSQVGPFWTMLYAAGAELVINGHDHDYERFAPQNPQGVETRPNGIREIVTGTGGGGLRQFHATAPNSEFRLAGSWGVLRLTLHPANYDWEFLPVDGDIADAGSALCH
jgi:calcineurin-like phosphoesterase family protein